MADRHSPIKAKPRANGDESLFDGIFDNDADETDENDTGESEDEIDEEFEEIPDDYVDGNDQSIMLLDGNAVYDSNDARNVNVKGLSPSEKVTAWHSLLELRGIKQYSNIADSMLKLLVASGDLSFKEEKCSSCGARVDEIVGHPSLIMILCHACMKKYLIEQGYKSTDVTSMTGIEILATCRVTMNNVPAIPVLPKASSLPPNFSSVVIDSVKRFRGIAVEKSAKSIDSKGKVTKQDLVDAILVEFITMLFENLGVGKLSFQPGDIIKP
jgi:hypothetical protein